MREVIRDDNRSTSTSMTALENHSYSWGGTRQAVAKPFCSGHTSSDPLTWATPLQTATKRVTGGLSNLPSAWESAKRLKSLLSCNLLKHSIGCRACAESISPHRW